MVFPLVHRQIVDQLLVVAGLVAEVVLLQAGVAVVAGVAVAVLVVVAADSFLHLIPIHE